MESKLFKDEYVKTDEAAEMLNVTSDNFRWWGRKEVNLFVADKRGGVGRPSYYLRSRIEQLIEFAKGEKITAAIVRQFNSSYYGVAETDGSEEDLDDEDEVNIDFTFDVEEDDDELEEVRVYTELNVDAEFESLIPPLSADEFQQLEENILSEGIRDPLVISDGILIDGHNRYKIAKKHNLPFNTVKMHFDNRAEIIKWIIKNQFGRRNLSAYERSILALKLKPVIAAQAKVNQSTHTQTGYQPLLNPSNAINTRAEIARAAGVSEDTISKVEKIEKTATPEIKAAVKSGEMSIHKAYESLNPRTYDIQKEFAKVAALREKYEKAKRQLELHIQNIIKGDTNGKY